MAEVRRGEEGVPAKQCRRRCLSVLLPLGQASVAPTSSPQGTFGRVFLARHSTQPGRFLALKHMKPSQVARGGVLGWQAGREGGTARQRRSARRRAAPASAQLHLGRSLTDRLAPPSAERVRGDLRHGAARGDAAQGAVPPQRGVPGGPAHLAAGAGPVPGVSLRGHRFAGRVAAACRGAGAQGGGARAGRAAGGTWPASQPNLACQARPADLYDVIRHHREHQTAMYPHIFKSVM